jgi:hypothetical protein
MGGTAVKKLLTGALVAALMLALAACGGSGDSSSSQSTATDSTQSTTAPSGEGSSDGNGANQKQGGDENGSANDQGGSSQDSSAGNRSGSAERSAEFRTPGGDNSIQNYGEEADTSELQEAEDAIVNYLDARAKANWAKSCEYLAALATEPLEKLAESSPKLKGKDCGAIVGALSAQVPKSALASPVTEGIASVRFQGDRGFALFHGPQGARFFMPLVKEDGEWKVGSLVASEFP